MKFNVYSVRDIRTGFMAPTMEINNLVAERNFSHAVQQSDSILFTHASDFQLFCIGTFDSDSGRIDPYDLPLLICDGKDVLQDV